MRHESPEDGMVPLGCRMVLFTIEGLMPRALETLYRNLLILEVEGGVRVGWLSHASLRFCKSGSERMAWLMMRPNLAMVAMSAGIPETNAAGFRKPAWQRSSSCALRSLLSTTSMPRWVCR